MSRTCTEQLQSGMLGWRKTWSEAKISLTRWLPSLGSTNRRRRPDGQRQEAKMPLLFWYLPFMIMSGAFDALYGQNGTRSSGRETRRI
jgi:hypothetical protein